jgi:hypothetical protein
MEGTKVKEILPVFTALLEEQIAQNEKFLVYRLPLSRILRSKEQIRNQALQKKDEKGNPKFIYEGSGANKRKVEEVKVAPSIGSLKMITKKEGKALEELVEIIVPDNKELDVPKSYLEDEKRNLILGELKLDICKPGCH